MIYTIEPIKILLGHNQYFSFSDDILLGKENLKKENLTTPQENYFKQLKAQSSIFKSILLCTISKKNTTKGFK